MAVVSYDLQWVSVAMDRLVAAFVSLVVVLVVFAVAVAAVVVVAEIEEMAGYNSC